VLGVSQSAVTIPTCEALWARMGKPPVSNVDGALWCKKIKIIDGVVTAHHLLFSPAAKVFQNVGLDIRIQISVDDFAMCRYIVKVVTPDGVPLFLVFVLAPRGNVKLLNPGRGLKNEKRPTVDGLYIP
jgi:hypothetical protein